MSWFVVIIGRKQKIPSETQLRNATNKSFAGGDGEVLGFQDATAGRIRMNFTGTLNHTRFQNALESEVPGSGKDSWEMLWGDSLLSMAEGMTYRLNIDIDPQYLADIYHSGESVTLIKHADGGSAKLVAWTARTTSSKTGSSSPRRRIPASPRGSTGSRTPGTAR